jgi:diadenylate cyclase
MRDLTLSDYRTSQGTKSVERAITALEDLGDTDLVDPIGVSKAIGYDDLDVLTEPRGVRLMAKAGRIPEHVREATVRHFKSFDRLITASAEDLEGVGGVGEVRARQLRYYFDRLLAIAENWSP